MGLALLSILVFPGEDEYRYTSSSLQDHVSILENVNKDFDTIVSKSESSLHTISDLNQIRQSIYLSYIDALMVKEPKSNKRYIPFISIISLIVLSTLVFMIVWYTHNIGPYYKSYKEDIFKLKTELYKKKNEIGQ